MEITTANLEPKSPFALSRKRRKNDGKNDFGDSRNHARIFEITKRNSGGTIWDDDADILKTDEGNEKTNARWYGEFKGFWNLTDNPSAKRGNANNEKENAVHKYNGHGFGQIESHQLPERFSLSFQS